MECIAPTYVRKYDITVPCGTCLACRVNKQNEWKTRLQITQQHSSSAYFITLTYDDEHMAKDSNFQPGFSKYHLQCFHKLMRKKLKQGNFISKSELGEFRLSLEDRPFKYYLIAEYGAKGENHRPHYHGLYFDLPDDIYLTDCLVRACWPNGLIQVDEITPGRINYVVNYSSDLAVNALWPDGRMRPFSLMSKGIGAQMLEEDLTYWHRSPHNRVYIPGHGVKYRMGRYLKERIFSEDERQRIADEKIKRDASAPELTLEEFDRKYETYQEWKRQTFNNLIRKKSHV